MVYAFTLHSVNTMENEEVSKTSYLSVFFSMRFITRMFESRLALEEKKRTSKKDVLFLLFECLRHSNGFEVSASSRMLRSVRWEKSPPDFFLYPPHPVSRSIRITQKCCKINVSEFFVVQIKGYN